MQPTWSVAKGAALSVLVGTVVGSGLTWGAARVENRRSPEHVHAQDAGATREAIAATVTATTETVFAVPSTCASSFVPHRLDTIVQARGEVTTYYDSNGAGLAADDLDGDGDLDLVIANLAGPNVVAWNEGGWTFREEPLTIGRSRGVAIVDLDGDGGRDLVFTQGHGSVVASRDRGGLEATASRFARSSLPGVTAPAFAMAWADVDGDGDLDLATASYDTMLEKDLRDTYLFGGRGGVYLYLDEGDRYRPIRLADAAQALAVTFYDADGDDDVDLFVGNDFEVPDFAYRNPGPSQAPTVADDWQRFEPFRRTTRNTMSFDVADVDRDGSLDLFATDMKPDFRNLDAIAAWLPLIDRGYRTHRWSERQLTENVLLLATARGHRNVAYRWGIDATGWSWAGRFGDLDGDGLLDLVVVNGMIALEAFPHLPGATWSEANAVYAGTSRGFEPADAWRLGAFDSGRGLVLADLDDDGDLDVAVSNLNAPTVAYENVLCPQGEVATVELEWRGTPNRSAVGAVVRLQVGDDTLTRTVSATAGYASGGDRRVHLAWRGGVDVGPLVVTWPDGAVSETHDLRSGARTTIVRDDARGVEASR